MAPCVVRQPCDRHCSPCMRVVCLSVLFLYVCNPAWCRQSDRMQVGAHHVCLPTSDNRDAVVVLAML
jgi:hypothetical protein